MRMSFFLCNFAAQNHFMAKQKEIIVKDTTIRSFSQNGWDYICITDIARQKNAIEPKDVVKNWMRLKNTIEYLGMWEALNNPLFKGVEFDPLLREAGSNAFTLSPSRWIELTGAIGIISKIVLLRDVKDGEILKSASEVQIFLSLPEKREIYLHMSKKICTFAG